MLIFCLCLHPVMLFSGLPQWLGSKEPACNAGDAALILGSGRSFGEGNGNVLQYSCLGNPMDRGVWWAIAHVGPKDLDMTWQLNNNSNNAIFIL